MEKKAHMPATTNIIISRVCCRRLELQIKLAVKIVVRRRISATLTLLHRQPEWMNILDLVNNVEITKFDLRHDYGAYSDDRG
mmetsp:Transcript_29307/g.45559  ORF Transcript_29307/g.45559 Transcript_29307/m.45559 type:complete len:82 (+) Transcript_29307:141-386(+)